MKVPAHNKAFTPRRLKGVTPQVAGSPPSRLRQGVGVDRWETAEGNHQLCVRGSKACMPEVWKYFARHVFMPENALQYVFGLGAHERRMDATTSCINHTPHLQSRGKCPQTCSLFPLQGLVR